MYYSKSYIPTLKEAPSDAEVVSHALLVRAGMIRRLTSGIYTWLPLGLRSLHKSAAIVRKYMNEAGAEECFMPSVQPADLWIESGRWVKYGKELLRFKDRHGRDYCMGPTHEEVITDFIGDSIHSYRQLPVNLYQIQTKFRDEIRPRFGIMRGREFLMKDAYSFDRDDAGADISYQSMYDAYAKIFSSMSLRFRAVQADSGAIGGSFSHEFMVLADTGEDIIVFCTKCDFASNLERAITVKPEKTEATCPPMEYIDTPNVLTIADVCDFLNCPQEKSIKTLIYDIDGKGVAVLLRGDRTLNDVKLKNFYDALEIVRASPEQLAAWTNSETGYTGPHGLKNCEVVIDHELLGDTDWTVGANVPGQHIQHFDLHRDIEGFKVADLRNIEEKDSCPCCGAPIEMAKGIEVGHVFKLGTSYSENMKATFLDSDGTEKPFVMGCYGIGVSRVIAAAIEQNHDEKGIIFPPPLAPYDLVLLHLDPKNAEATAKAEAIYKELEGLGLEVLFDDREERPGIKFNDADLIGIPMQVIVGSKGLEKGIVETKNRKTGEKSTLPLDDFLASFKAWHESVLDSWK